MSTTDTAQTATEAAQSAQDASDVLTEDESQEKPQEGGNREAAKYRRQAREAQAELESVRAQLAAAQSTVLQNAAVQIRLDKGATLRPDAVQELDHAGMVTDEGSLNQEALQEQLERLHQERPYLFERPQGPSSSAIGRVNSAAHLGERADSFEAAFAPKG